MNDGQRVRMVGQSEQHVIAVNAMRDGFGFDAVKRVTENDFFSEFRLEKRAVCNRLPRFEPCDISHAVPPSFGSSSMESRRSAESRNAGHQPRPAALLDVAGVG